MTVSSSTSPDRSAATRAVRPAVARGRLRVPPSKSVSHRQLALALLAGAPVEVEHPLRAEDIELFLDVLRRLGWTVEDRGDLVRLPEEPRLETRQAVAHLQRTAVHGRQRDGVRPLLVVQHVGTIRRERQLE